MKCAFLFVVAVLVLSEIGAYPQLQRQQPPRAQGQGGGQGVLTPGRERGIGEGGKAPGHEEEEERVQGHDVGQDHVHAEGEVHSQEAEPAHEHKEGEGVVSEEGRNPGPEIGQGVGEEGGRGEGHEDRLEHSGEPKVNVEERRPIAGAGEVNVARENGGVGARGVVSGKSGKI